VEVVQSRMIAEVTRAAAATVEAVVVVAETIIAAAAEEMVAPPAVETRNKINAAEVEPPQRCLELIE